MTLFAAKERRIAQAMVDHAYCNPFLPKRVKIEKQLLGADFIPTPPVIHLRAGQSVVDAFPNVGRLLQMKSDLIQTARQSLIDKRAVDSDELRIYEELSLTLLYSRHVTPLEKEMANPVLKVAGRRIDFWPVFRDEFNHLLRIPGVQFPCNYSPEHVFACFYQFHRAFSQVFGHIIGSSMAVARLRAAVWESLFTHDLARYARVMYQVMGSMTTLVTGPSGSGKELVARAIAFSQYVPFDPSTQAFVRDFFAAHHPVNLAALPLTLIESELFGHKKGAFTGATADRKGWVENCLQGECVFLDEIGELDGSVQVKLLRVLQERKFNRLGDTREREFAGKIAAATNRDLAAEMHEGRFRADLYYRLCSDVIQTPSLQEQLAESPDDLPIFVSFIVEQILRDNREEAVQLAEEITAWIMSNLGPDYAWPGNIRELEQCVRNVMIRKQYVPATTLRLREHNPHSGFLADVDVGGLSLGEITSKYYALVFAKYGSYQEAARQLGVDWRTVKNRMDDEFLREITDANATKHDRATQ